MNILVPLLIVAINPDAPIEARDELGTVPIFAERKWDCPPPESGATEVFYCPFDESWDTNYDGQPDRWVRRRGPGFPHYVKVGISEEPSPAAFHEGRSLRIDLDGGAAALFSPPIPVGPLYAYVLSGVLATEGLEHDRAYLSLTLLDKDRRRLETFHSERIRDSQGWKQVRLGPVTPDDETRFAVIGLHLEPGAPMDRARRGSPDPAATVARSGDRPQWEEMDLTGSARFDEVWLGRLPRISLSAGDGPHVFTDPGQITVACNASGLQVENPTVVFRLEDVFGATLAEGRERMKTRSMPGDHPLSRNAPPSRSAGLPTPSEPWLGQETGHSVPDEPPSVAGTAEWKPPIPGPGFYRVKASVDVLGASVDVLGAGLPTPPKPEWLGRETGHRVAAIAAKEPWR